MPDADLLLEEVLDRVPDGEQSPLSLGEGERHVTGALMTDPEWLREQLRLRGQRWSTDDQRVLATLWWYSVSVWAIAPTVASLVLSDRVLSAEPDDLTVHWLPDSRVTGATSSRVLPDDDALQAAGTSIRALYDTVIPVLAEVGEMRARPLWAIAADSLAGRLLRSSRAAGEATRAVALLGPLTEAIGGPLPLTRWASEPVLSELSELKVRRCSCCLLYLAPRQSMCGNCPRKRSQETRSGVR